MIITDEEEDVIFEMIFVRMKSEIREEGGRERERERRDI